MEPLEACSVCSKSVVSCFVKDTQEVFAYRGGQTHFCKCESVTCAAPANTYLFLSFYVKYTFSLWYQTGLRVLKRLSHSCPSWRHVLPFFLFFLAGDFEGDVPANSQQAGGRMQNCIKECCAVTSPIIYMYVTKQLELMKPVKE